MNMPMNVTTAAMKKDCYHSWPASVWFSRAKLQRAGAVQDASRDPVAFGKRASVVECGGPPPLFWRAGFQGGNVEAQSRRYN
jgi:hypothetical protein